MRYTLIYMSNSGKFKITVESCLLLIALIITSCLYTAKFSKSRDDFDIDKSKTDVSHESEKKQGGTKKKIFDKSDYKAEGYKSYTVVIDAGHGGKDEGASSKTGRFKEKNCNLAIVKKLKMMLDQTDINVIYTRLDDRYLTKRRRVVIANEKSADLFISVHCNSSDNIYSKAFGVETLFAKRRGDNKYMTSRRLAYVLLSSVSKSSSNKARKIIRREDLYVLTHTQMPAVIVETGYMSSAKDMNYIRSIEGQYEIADGVYKGIIKSLKEMGRRKNRT